MYVCMSISIYMYISYVCIYVYVDSIYINVNV